MTGRGAFTVHGPVSHVIRNVCDMLLVVVFALTLALSVRLQLPKFLNHPKGPSYYEAQISMLPELVFVPYKGTWDILRYFGIFCDR